MTKSEVLRRTWVDISLDAIDYNFRKIKAHVGNAMVMAVVKADAYGHGDRMTAPFLEEAGADWFGVSNLGEALGIRESGVTKPILIFGNTPAECVSDLAKWNITQTAYSLHYAKELSAEAEKLGVTLDVHLKFDTGMGRIGFVCSEDNFDVAVSEAEEAAKLPNIRVTGAFTHFASADEPDSDGESYTRLQFDRFCRVCDALKEKGIRTVSVMGYRDNETFLQEELKSVCKSYVATEDGSVGTKGNVIDAIKENGIEGDIIFACGPTPMLRALKEYAAENNIASVIISFRQMNFICTVSNCSHANPCVSISKEVCCKTCICLLPVCIRLHVECAGSLHIAAYHMSLNLFLIQGIKSGNLHLGEHKPCESCMIRFIS